jgi:BirA family biotin operon repressor/biotin-[acetyl-CoA-carboxylase] ligase
MILIDGVLTAMLDEDRLHGVLPVSGFGEPFFFYQTVDSTNDVAIDLANQGMPHGALVIAKDQTAGRGQRGRQWITVQGSGLALSIILRPAMFVGEDWIKYHALGALAVVSALEGYGLDGTIKWPNDVLLSDGKVAGVLVDVSWEGERVEFVVLGIGVNVCPNPVLTHGDFDLPATSIEENLRKTIDWHELIKGILSSLGIWYSRIHQTSFIKAWEKKLAYRGENVIVSSQDGKWRGRIDGLSDKGELRITGDEGLIVVQNNRVQIRPVDKI